MARTFAEIEQEIEKQAEAFPKLEALQSNSSMVAFWTYAKKMVAFVALTLEKFLDQHKVDVDAIIEKTETGSIDWYLNLCYAYQHGDSLIIDNNRPVYSTPDESKRIIKRASIKEDENATLHIKAVKENNGELTPLNGNELASFTAYLNRSKIAGTKIEVQSPEAELLKLQIKVSLDPVLFDSDGNRLSDGRAPVLEAIEAHLKVFDFRGVFYLSRLIDSVMNVEGVKDFFITNAQLGDKVVTHKVESDAGYIKIDPNTHIEYVLS